MNIPSDIPRHVAIIMDGNGRWAKKRFLPRAEGHRAGVKTVRTVVEAARRAGVRYLTLYTFSSENWKRPAFEVETLMKLFARSLESELELMLKNNIRLRAIGDLSKLPQTLRQLLLQNQERTLSNDAMDLILAVSYGGRDEILHAARALAAMAQRGEIDPAKIDSSLFAAQLYAPDIPDPDLIIRTSSEERISNFLLWQSAYSEMIVRPVLWPDFTEEELLECFKIYASRGRRFGLTSEQIEGVSGGA